jgi:hypothetical protein
MRATHVRVVLVHAYGEPYPWVVGTLWSLVPAAEQLEAELERRRRRRGAAGWVQELAVGARRAGAAHHHQHVAPHAHASHHLPTATAAVVVVLGLLLRGLLVGPLRRLPVGGEHAARLERQVQLQVQPRRRRAIRGVLLLLLAFFGAVVRLPVVPPGVLARPLLRPRVVVVDLPRLHAHTRSSHNRNTHTYGRTAGGYIYYRLLHRMKARLLARPCVP